MEKPEAENIKGLPHLVELDLPPPSFGRARTLAALALRECLDVLSVANKGVRPIISRRLKAARRQEREVSDLEKRPATPHNSTSRSSVGKTSTRDGASVVKPPVTATGRQREGIRVVIAGHPEIIAYRYGNPNRDLIDAKRILEGRRRELGID